MKGHPPGGRSVSLLLAESQLWETIRTEDQQMLFRGRITVDSDGMYLSKAQIGSWNIAGEYILKKSISFRKDF